MCARAGWLLGTGGVDVQQAEGFFLNGRRPRDHDDPGFGIEWRVTDVVRERGQIIEQRAKAMYRQAILGEPGGVLGFRLVRASRLGHR